MGQFRRAILGYEQREPRLAVNLRALPAGHSWHPVVVRLPPRHWTLAHRVVLVVASGLALRVLARWALYDSTGSESGWFGYAPQTVGRYIPGGGSRFGDGATAVLSVAFIGLWVMISFWLLRRPD